MKMDNYGEVINHQTTYQEVARILVSKEQPVILGWTDERSTHYDILFTYNVWNEYHGQLQGGIKRSDLFVSIMRLGAFGFEIEKTDTHASYYSEKLGVFSEELTELINGIKKELVQWETVKNLVE